MTQVVDFAGGTYAAKTDLSTAHFLSQHSIRRLLPLKQNKINGLAENENRQIQLFIGSQR